MSCSSPPPSGEAPREEEVDLAADHYGVLGLPQSAAQAEIKAAHRRLARIHHPGKDSRERGLGRAGDVGEDGVVQGASGEKGDGFLR